MNASAALATCRPAVALEHLPCAALLADATGAIVGMNPEAATLLQQPGSFKGTLQELLAASGIDGQFAAPVCGSAQTRLKLNDGRVLGVCARRIAAGDLVLTFADVSAYAQEAELAQKDALTGLASRSALHARLAERLARGEALALFVIGLDRFRAVNETLGHPVGDVLLRKAAERIVSIARPGDLIARLAGDVFVLVQAGVDPQSAQSCAARLVDLIGRTYVVEGHIANVGCSAGVAIAPADGAGVTELLRNAELALHRAKAGGRERFRFFAPSMDARMQRRRELELGLRRALAMKELQLVYQPQVQLDTGEVCGFEALVRWHSPTGPVSPGEFIPIAEETGLIVPIGEWVLRTACSEAASWPKPVTVAVNVSAQQFGTDLLRTVALTLKQTGLSAERLDLEITEGVLLEDTDSVLQTLHSLKALGVRVSMDDFGTGYSSLSYLQKFPFDKIKLDQSFVRGLANNPGCGAIVRAVAGLGKSLGIKTTAEGVETLEELSVIQAEGYMQVQGYLTGRPLGPQAAIALLTQPHLQEETHG